MLTPLGKILRIIRINTGDSATEMAFKLHISPSYLSAIENGKRNIPYDMEKLISSTYPLSTRDIQRMRDSIKDSTKMISFDLTLLSEKAKKVLFAVTNGEVQDEDLTTMCEMVDKKKIS